MKKRYRVKKTTPLGLVLLLVGTGLFFYLRDHKVKLFSYPIKDLFS